MGELHGEALMKALSAVALDVQRARTHETVFKAAGEGLNTLDMSLCVMRIDSDVMRLVYVNLTEAQREAMGLAGKPFEGIAIPQSQLSEALEARTAIVHEAVLADTVAFFGSYDAERAGEVPDLIKAGSFGKLIIAPVFVEGQPWGGVTVGGNKLVDEDLAAVKSFTLQVTSAIEVADTIARLEQRNRELEAVHTIATTRLTGDIAEQTRQLLGTLAEATRSNAASLHLYDPATNEYVLQPSPFGVSDEVVQNYLRFPNVPGTLMTRTQHVSDVPTWSELLKSAHITWLGTVPIAAEGKPVAFVALGRESALGFLPAELRTAEILGVQIVALLERTRLNAELSQRVRQLSMLFELARAGTTLREVAPLVDRLLGLVIDHLPCDTASILYTRGDKLEMGGWKPREGVGLPDSIALTHVPFDDSTVSGRALRYGRVLTMAYADAPELTRLEMGALGIRHVMVAPLVVGERHFGALWVGRLAEKPFVDGDLKLMESCAAQVSVLVEHVKLFDDLRQSYAHLEHAQAEIVRHERLAALGELAAVMAHEVRNPLGVIFNSLTTLKKRVQLSPDVSLLLGIVGEEADRLNRIVGDLLDFARPYEAERSPIALEPVVASAIDAASQQLSAQVKVVTEFGDELPRFVVDGHLVRQALINLVVNAIQAIPKGGTVTVRVNAESREGQPLARIEVTDDGVGISPQTEKHIFQPFFTTKAMGTGLGLAVVKRIVDAHHGEISVRSSMGGGTTFTVTLPSMP